MFRLRPVRELARDPMFVLLMVLVVLYLVLGAVNPDSVWRTVLLLFQVATLVVDHATRTAPKEKADDEPSA